ncbi:MAG: hypothetical protein DMG23_13580, partial [Acidobacteria bacterium]
MQAIVTRESKPLPGHHPTPIALKASATLLRGSGTLRSATTRKQSSSNRWMPASGLPWVRHTLKAGKILRP